MGIKLADSSASFTIGGNPAQAISPGAGAPLNLRLTNPHTTPLSVTDLRVKVQKVNAPNADLTHPCTMGDFAVKQNLSHHKITLPARSTRTLNNLGIPAAMWPQLRMLDLGVDQDGCKAASLTLSYTASGRTAN